MQPESIARSNYQRLHCTNIKETQQDLTSALSLRPMYKRAQDMAQKRRPYQILTQSASYCLTGSQYFWGTHDEERTEEESSWVRGKI